MLHIGFLGSLDDWRREDVGYTVALRDSYRLILPDPRGQGRSDGPHDPTACGPRQRVGDVLPHVCRFLDRLGSCASPLQSRSPGSGEK